MFTGIIQETGKITNINVEKHHAQVKIACQKLAKQNLSLGASIAVNGICLTVTSWQENEFSVDVMPETMHRTNLGKLVKGSVVNLEPSLKVGQTLDGHIVAGHIDTTAKIVGKKELENSIELKFRLPSKYAPYVVEKGSIALDGISLTVTLAKDDEFGVSLIPFTIKHTSLSQYSLGDEVNVETDMLGKYFVKQSQIWQEK